jgi:chorismate mutase
MDKIKKLRKKVDTVDGKLVYLLAERFKITKEIMLLKKKNGISVKDKTREDYIFKEATNLAKKLKIDMGFIADIFKKILKESKK